MPQGHDVSVIDFGADPTGGSSSTHAFNCALSYALATGCNPATGGVSVYVPSGIYLIDSTIFITLVPTPFFSGTSISPPTPVGPYIKLFGSGPQTTTLLIKEPAMPVMSSYPAIQVMGPTISFTQPNPFAFNFPTVIIGDMSVVRSAKAQNANAAGIIAGSNYYYWFYNLVLRFHWNGFQLGTTEDSTIIDCKAFDCASNGFYFANDPLFLPAGPQQQLAPYPQIQWSLLNVASQGNGSNGYAVNANPFFTASNHSFALFSPYVTLNSWQNVYSSANAGYGLLVSGFYDLPNQIIYGIYNLNLSNCTFNDDLAGEMYINSLGGQVNITGSSIGLGGSSSNFGHGIVLSKNTDVLISDTIIYQNMGSGVYIDNSGLIYQSAALDFSKHPPGMVAPMTGEVSINGCRLINNNFNIADGRHGTYSGVNIVNDTFTNIVGCRIGGDQEIVNTQTYCIDTYDASTTIVTGCNLYLSNPTLPGSSPAINLGANPTLLRASSNLGFVTSSCGLSAAIPVGGTFVTITHNLSGIPQGISVVPYNVDLAIPTNTTYFVKYVTTTQFSILLSQPLPGSLPAQFYWTATLNALG